MGADDAELMERWRRGDAVAFESLVRRWQQPVARFLYRMTGRAGCVHDLCQEVFLRVYRAGGRYREVGGFAGWLYRIALNVARDELRRQRPRAAADLSDHEPVDPGGGAESICARRELAAQMARALAELPEPLRLVVALRHEEGLGFEEIARLTSTPASTLKSRFAAALARLRTRLEQLGYGPEEISP